MSEFKQFRIEGDDRLKNADNPDVLKAYAPKNVMTPAALINSFRTKRLLNGKGGRYRKVFAIGLNKTGTSSINTIFLKAGLHATHSLSWREPRLHYVHYHYQAFSDGIPFDVTFLDETFPNSQFILNVRSLDEWLDSRMEHVKFHMKSDPNFVENGGWGISQKAIIYGIKTRQKYHAAVLRYFRMRPDDLLIVNYIADPNAAEKISKFIGGREVKDKPYTRPIPKNREAGRLKNQEAIAEALTALGVAEAEWKNDLLCPSLLSDADREIFVYDTRL